MNAKEKIFLSVLEKHKGIIFKVANTYCFDDFDKEDLIQEITLQIWLSINKYNSQYKYSTWIYRIALNTSISFYRKNKSRKEQMVNLQPIIEFSSNEETVYQDEHVNLLRKYVRELKEIDRAFILLYLEGLNSKEIANIMNSSQTNVTTKISRIKNKLKQKFNTHKQ